MKILDNGIAIVESDSHIGKWVQESGRLDHDLTVEAHILPLIGRDFVVVEGGANIGTHTVRYAQAAHEGVVMAFEPNQRSYECLLHNTRNLPNVITRKLGLSDQYENVEMLEDATNVGATYLTRKEGNAQCCMLDIVFMWPQLYSYPHFSRWDFFKLDVEGYELFALRGAQNSIARFKPTILVEMNAGTLARNGISYNDIFQFLAEMGYEWRSFAQTVDLMNEPQYDLLATPKTKTA